ncbi:MAG: hypothetical protein WEF86_02360 [Gemmatimonadota bacterium]
MMSPQKKYWFPAKRYGWGWGFPSAWQGWLVFAAFIALLVGASLLFPPDEQLGRYLGCVFVLAALLVAVAWAKGEPPRWRWGNDQRA